MGPREFVPFPEKLDFNIDNIKSACLKHFAPTIGNDVVSDILAGEQGPSLRGPLSKIHPSVFERKNKFPSYFVYELDFGQH